MLAQPAILFVDRLRQSEAGTPRASVARANLTFFAKLKQNEVNAVVGGSPQQMRSTARLCLPDARAHSLVHSWRIPGHVLRLICHENRKHRIIEPRWTFHLGAVCYAR